MALTVGTNSSGPGRVKVRWSSTSAYPAYHSSRASAYLVVVAVSNVTHDYGNNSLDDEENWEWIALIRDSSVTTIQLDTVSLQQSGGSVVVQSCSRVTSENFGNAFRVDKQSKTCSWRASQSTSVTTSADVVRRNNWQDFISQVIRRLVPEVFISLAHWITSKGQN